MADRDSSGNILGKIELLNSNLLREATKFDKDATVFITAGRKGSQFIARTKRKLAAELRRNLDFCRRHLGQAAARSAATKVSAASATPAGAAAPPAPVPA